MGFGDVHHEMPLEVKLATENGQLHSELEGAKKMLGQLQRDLASERTRADEAVKNWQALTAAPAAFQPGPSSESIGRAVARADDAEEAYEELNEKYETLQEMVKLYRKLVKVPVEDVGGTMGLDEYIALSARTDNKDLLDRAGGASAIADLLHLSVAALGLCGEAGEFADLIKKHIHQGHELNQDQLVKELGDVLWYWAKACRILGVSGDVVALRNIEKLKVRYDKGFSTEASKARVDEQ